MGEALLVRRGGGGVKVTVDGEKISKPMDLKSKITNICASSVPYLLQKSSNQTMFVVFREELHMLGGKYGASSHYKWNENVWEKASTLPFLFNDGSAAVCKDEIHIFDRPANSSKHYKWDGETWTKAASLPIQNINAYNAAVACNDSIYWFTEKNVYKLNEDTWTIVKSGSGVLGSPTIYNGEICGIRAQKICKWNDLTQDFVDIVSLSGDVEEASVMVVKNNEIYLSSGKSLEPIYKWTGNEFNKFCELPRMSSYAFFITFNGEINLLGSGGLSTAEANALKQTHWLVATKVYKEI